MKDRTNIKIVKCLMVGHKPASKEFGRPLFYDWCLRCNKHLNPEEKDRSKFDIF